MAAEYVQAGVITGLALGKIFSSFFWGATQLVVTDVSGQPVEMEPIGCIETSLDNSQSALRNVPEERRPHVKA
jgi:hypothetical protein